MTYTKRLVCFANSRKLKGRCIAGMEVTRAGLGTGLREFGRWIRPVSERSTHAISKKDRRYESGSMPRVLDIIEIEMKRREPLGYQRENHVIDSRYYWTRVGRASWSQVLHAVEKPTGPLWSNAAGSSKGGINDRVSEARARTLRRSLYLVRTKNLRIIVTEEDCGLAGPKRKVRARFRVSGEEYCLAVTDPVVKKEYRTKKNGEFRVGDAVVCVSLGEGFKGYAYKLAASIITP